MICMFLLCASSLYAGFLTSPLDEQKDERIQLWVDLYTGEEVPFEQVLRDLNSVDIVYLGEVHTIRRHHHLYRRIIENLGGNNGKIVLVMEQIEITSQEDVDRYNTGKIDFDTLAKVISWREQWSNYREYRDIVETVRKKGGLIAAANAPGQIIRKIARKGLVSLHDADRALLPRRIDQGPESYRKLLEKIMMVHAFMPPDRLQFMYEAQVSRDETMASVVSSYAGKKTGQGEKYRIVVLAGAAHVRYGFGIPYRVRSRHQDVTDRIVVSSSSELVLSKEQKLMSREIEMTHEDFRFITHPLADYLFFISNTKQDSTP